MDRCSTWNKDSRDLEQISAGLNRDWPIPGVVNIAKFPEKYVGGLSIGRNATPSTGVAGFFRPGSSRLWCRSQRRTYRRFHRHTRWTTI